MKYKINWNCSDGVFAVPDLAADCLKLASGKAVKVLLYILKNKITDVPMADIGKAVGISEEDAEDALSYWRQIGLIFPEGEADVQTAVASSPKAESAKPAPEVKKTETISDARAREKAIKMLSPAEIAERVDGSEELRFLFTSAEKVFGRLLNHTEQRTLIWIYDYYGIAPDLLVMIIEFAKTRNKKSIGFIEKIAEQWQNDGISTHEQAEREILRMQNYNTLAGQVTARLGLNRTLTSTERKYITDWSLKNISIDLIVYAYEKTVDNIGKVKFSYMNTILLDWYGKGCFTPEDVKRSGGKAPEKSSAAEKADSGEHSYNLDLLVEHALTTVPKMKY